MSARQDIEKYLGQWLELTQEEAGAIQSSKWVHVREIQSSKAALKKSLTAARERMIAEIEELALPDAEQPLRKQIGRLMSLENRNADLMAGQMKRARTEQERRDEAMRNLRRLRRSYGTRPETDWEKYS